MNNQATPDPVDVHVGARLRLRRKLMEISQSALADALGLTFQQVQKYERGSNRISASKLYAAAQRLQVPVEWFFEGLDMTPLDPELAQKEAALNQRFQALMSTPEGVEIAEAFPQIRRGEARRHLAALVKALSREE
jgi:transcriptional regulator with XRE-family HTH domain